MTGKFQSQEENLGLQQDGPGQAELLLLAVAEVVPVADDLRVEAALHAAHHNAQPDLLQRLPDLTVGELRAGVQVAPHGAAEEGHVLGDGQGEAPEPGKFHTPDVLYERV